MAELADDVIVDCPSGEAEAHIADFFERLGARNGGGATLTLRVNVGDLTVSREVIATLKRQRSPLGCRLMEIAWAPKGGGPYPVFGGMLSLADETRAKSRLAIRGAYGPPGGVAGAAFDAVIGHRIAASALKTLLEMLKTAIEAARTETAASAARYLPTYE